MLKVKFICKCIHKGSERTDFEFRSHLLSSNVFSINSELISVIYSFYFSLALCELCGYIGDREAFYSKSKRFCKMECAKKYSACQKKNIHKGVSSKKHVPKRKLKIAAKSKKVFCIKINIKRIFDFNLS